MKKLIIVPAYNEEDAIERTIVEIKDVLGFDYVIINDCSTDKTKEICKSRGYNVVNLPVNLGIGGAVQTGYKFAYDNGYDIAVQIDGDGQHNPVYLGAMAEVMEKENVDMVIGSRYIEKQGFQSSFLRRIGINYLSALIFFLTRKKITDPTSGLRMVNRKLIKDFAERYPKDYPEPETTMSVICKGLAVKEIPVKMRSRQGGVSSINPSKSVYYMIKVSLAIIVEKMRGI